MKRILFLSLFIILAFGLCACNKSDNTATVGDVTVDEAMALNNEEGIDVDLTKLSSTMIYSEVYNMTNNPEKYIGKKVRIFGETSVYLDETTNKIYYACIVSDATACCAQGLEFVMKDEDEYPEAGKTIIIDGVFNTYEEDGNTYCQLADAEYA